MSRKDPTIRFGLVESVDDPTGSGRIRVRMAYDDRGLPSNELAYAFPLNPKIWHVKPKVGEGVFIFNQILTEQTTQRYYIGPIVSQPQYMYYDDYKTSTRTLFGTKIGPDVNIQYTKTDQVKGVLPKDDSVAVLGRKDSDIILEDDALYIRCGVKKTSENDDTDFEFNSLHPAFIKLQHEPDHLKADEQGYESVVNIVADKINLISTDSTEFHKIADNNNDLLPEKELNDFIAKSHEVPYGDVLVKFLKIFRKAFLNHQHAWAQKPPTSGTEGYKNLVNFNIDSMLSQSIKIN